MAAPAPDCDSREAASRAEVVANNDEFAKLSAEFRNDVLSSATWDAQTQPLRVNIR